MLMLKVLLSMAKFNGVYENRQNLFSLFDPEESRILHAIIDQDACIGDAMKAINSSGLGICFVCDEGKRITGLVTDGNIRRGLLNNHDLSSPVEAIVQHHFHYVVNDSNWELEADFLAYAHNLECIPVLDNEGCLSNILFPHRQHVYKVRENAVVIMAGGLGSRLLPLTANCPKPLLQIGSKPILERIIIYFKYYGFRNFYISIGYLGYMIQEYFGDGKILGVNIQYVNEKSRRGTAGALSLLPQKPSLPFIVTNGDLIMNLNLDEFLNYHVNNMHAATMCIRQHSIQIPFGVVNVHDKNLMGIVEKPDYTFLINAGVYCFNPEVLNFVPSDSYFDMPLLFDALLKNKYKTGTFQWDGSWIDVGTVQDYQRLCGETTTAFDLQGTSE